MRIVKYYDDSLCEGIDFDNATKLVSFNPSHEKNVDTSYSTNPTIDDSIFPNVKVYSIFKRKNNSHGDGNPLIYALKNENGWKFRSISDKIAIESRFNAIAEKFAKLYPIGLTIIIPSGNKLNKHIADVILSKSKNSQLITGVIRKLTTIEVDEIVMNKKSKFRQYYKKEFNTAYDQLQDYLEDMNKRRRGRFSRHLIKDNEMRKVLDFTFVKSSENCSRFAKIITGNDILLIDDTISKGQSIKDACKIIFDNYHPKSITVLTLLSKLYK